MEIVFLGTSSGAPTKTRNVSALAIKAENAKNWYLVDCGEGTQHRLLQADLSLYALAGVFVTHIHGDHCYGLPGLLASAALAGRKKPLTIAGPAALKIYLDMVRDITRMHLSYELRFTAVETLPRIELEDFRVQTAALSHRMPSFAYVFQENRPPRKLDTDKLKAARVPPGPLWGRLQRDAVVELPDGSHLISEDFLLPAARPRKILVCGDNDRPELLERYCRDADVLIHEATYTEDIIAKVGAGRQHSSAAQVAKFAQQAGIANLILTHFSPRYRSDASASPSLRDIETEARLCYDGSLFLACDFDRYQLNRDYALLKIGTEADC